MQRRTARTNGLRARGNIQAKTFQKTGSHSVASLQENVPKSFSQLGNCAVLAGPSAIFELFFLVKPALLGESGLFQAQIIVAFAGFYQIMGHFVDHIF